MEITPIQLWRNQKKVASLIGKTGEILQWTMIHVPPKAFTKEVPYPVIIVQLDNGKRIIGQLVDWESRDLQKGRKVIAVLRHMQPENQESIIAYGIKFKPYGDH